MEVAMILICLGVLAIVVIAVFATKNRKPLPQLTDMSTLKVSDTAFKTAKEKLENDKRLEVCLEARICPKCGYKLNKSVSCSLEHFTDYLYECENCGFATLKGEEW